MRKFEPNDVVWVKIGAREPFQTKILGRVNRKTGSFYLIDWSPGGFNSLLNTVPISESAIHEKRT